MRTVYILQNLAGRTQQQVTLARAALLQRAKELLEEEELNVETVTPAAGQTLMNSNPRNLQALFADEGNSALFWIEEPRGIPIKDIGKLGLGPKINHPKSGQINGRSKQHGKVHKYQ